MNFIFHLLARMCPALRQLAFGTVEPVDCVTTPQPYQRGCIMKCVIGYVMEGDSPLTCGADGTWQGVFPTCKGTLHFSLVSEGWILGFNKHRFKQLR